MSIRLAIAGIAAAASMCPALSLASADDPALDACAKEFAAGLSAHADAPSVAYNITFLNRGYVETEAQYEAGIYTYDLVAHERKSGVAVARAKCLVDERGAVTALSYAPLTFAAPELASD